MAKTRTQRGKPTTRVTRSTTRPRTGSYGAGGYGTDQSYHAIHAGPWIVLGLGLALGIVLNAFTSTTMSVFGMVALIIAATLGLGYSAWMTSRQRSGVARWHSLITVLYGGGWLALCTVTGVIYTTPAGSHLNYYGQVIQDYSYHLVGITDALWLVGGGALAIAWNNRIGTRVGEAKEAAINAAREIEPVTNTWEEATNSVGITVKGQRVNQYFTEGTVRLRGRDNTLETLRRNLRQIEIMEGWPYESLTLMPHPTSNNAQYLRYRVMHADPLANPVPWPGLGTGGRKKLTLLDPIDKGVGDDGNVYGLHVAKAGVGGLHRLVVGMNGSGKTVSEAPDLIVSAARGADNIVIDTVKQIQSYGELAAIMQLFVIDPGMARALIERLMSHVLPARTQQLAREGRKIWTPGSKLNFLRLHVEEAWQIADAGEIVDISLAFRSAGGQLTYSIQRPTFDQMPVTLRAQLATVVHFGIKEKDDEQYALPDEVRDAGGHPSKWGNDQPGMHLAIQGGMPLVEQVRPRRSWQDPGEVNPNDPNSFANTAERVGRTLHDMDPITAGALGELWTNRVKPVDLVRRVKGDPAIPGPATKEALTVNPPTQEDTNMPTPTLTALPSDVIEGDVADMHLPTYSTDGQNLVFDGSDGLPAENFDLGGDIDPRDIADPYADLPAAPEETRTMRIGVPTDPNAIPRGQYEAAMEARLVELLTDPATDLIMARDFIPVQQSCHWSRPSIYDFLKDWTEAGRIAKLSSGKGWIPVRNRT